MGQARKKSLARRSTAQTNARDATTDTPVRDAFRVRGLALVADLARAADVRTLSRALETRNDLDFLVEIARTPALMGLAESPALDPLAGARLRGVRKMRALLAAEGGSWSVAQAAEHLGISEQAVHKRLEATKLLAVQPGGFRYALPAWQFDRSGVIAGLDDVLGAFAVEDPWMRLHFFLSQDARLGGDRPLDALRKGRVADVMRSAAAWGEHGAP